MNPKYRAVRAVIGIGLLCLFPAFALATGQQPDVIIYNGKTYALFANPLEEFYKDQKSRPLFRVKPHVVSTGNWRGYVATWAIENGFLYLVKVDAWICSDWDAKSCRKVKLRGLFGSRYRNGKVKANWFSGDLRLPEGKLLQYVHMGYGSVYERELTLSVESGRVMKESVIDNTRITLPSELELQRRELEKMKPNPVRKSKTGGRNRRELIMSGFWEATEAQRFVRRNDRSYFKSNLQFSGAEKYLLDSKEFTQRMWISGDKWGCEFR